MASTPSVLLERAINAITLAAEEIPAEDFITYSTILDIHLESALQHYDHKDQVAFLTALVGILAKYPGLTANIGWDLVAVLLPFFEERDEGVDLATKDCLKEVAEKGNPREVILKIVECLRQIPFVDQEDDEEEGSDEDQNETPEGEDEEDGESLAARMKQEAQWQSVHVSALKFHALLGVLDQLHLRIRTKFPSRFLSTSLTAILNTYTDAVKVISAEMKDKLTMEIMKFIGSVSRLRQSGSAPALPPRSPGGEALEGMTTQAQPVAPKAEDPEAEVSPPSAKEADIQRRLLQSFLTHIFEDYMLSFKDTEEPGGLAWSTRMQEKFNPAKAIPGRVLVCQRFNEDPILQFRERVARHFVTLSTSLSISDTELLDLTQRTTPTSPSSEPTGPLAAPPTSSSSIPFSQPGALFLLTAKAFNTASYDRRAAPPPLPIFPTHAQIVLAFLGRPDRGGLVTIGTESTAVIDAVLALGLWAIQSAQKSAGAHPDLGVFEEGEEEEGDEEFTQYLQTLSLLSAHTPSPPLRYTAHTITTTILHAHPRDLVRLAFIRDTLEDCPFENLKASAVGWIKDEIIAANAASSPPGSGGGENIFTTLVAVDTLAPFLFPNLTGPLVKGEVRGAWTLFKSGFGFFLAVLNFYYFLLEAKYLHQTLDVQGLRKKHDINKGFVGALKVAGERFGKELEEGGAFEREESGAGVASGRADLRILEVAVERVEEAGKGAAEWGDWVEE